MIHLSYLVKRLQKKLEQYKKYNEGFQADLEKAYIVEVSFHQQNDTGWYISHYGLVSPNKPDKIRRICKAKAPQSVTSLNEKILAGPDLIGNLLGHLPQFRQKAIAIQGGIEGFLKIEVRKQDRRYMRVVWRHEQNSPELEVYGNQRHIFGAMNSPACANFFLATDSQR